MIITLNKDGTVNKIIQSRNFQGSEGFNEIELHGAFEEHGNITEARAVFKLPDGTMQENVMTNIEANRWTYPIDWPLTTVYGRVLFSFAFDFENPTRRLTTPIITMNIEISFKVGD